MMLAAAIGARGLRSLSRKKHASRLELSPSLLHYEFPNRNVANLISFFATGSNRAGELDGPVPFSAHGGGARS
jgi:hypothetical protein